MFFKGGLIFSKSKIFFFACLSFGAGVGAASFFPSGLLALKIYWFSAALAGLMIVVWLKASRPAAELKIAESVVLLAAVFCLAVWRYALSLPAGSPDKIWHYNGRDITVRGVIVSEPDIRETNQKLTLAVTSLKQAPGKNITGKILLTAELYPEYDYGDELEISGELKQPEEFNGFAYDRYLARYDVFSVCYYPEIKFLSGGRGNYFYAKIFALKKTLAGLIDAGLSEPEASLARPIVFGGQRGLEQKIRDDFQTVGLTHIMAVSGFNVSILAAAVMAALLTLGLDRGRAFYAASLLLAAYVVLVGLPASAMRAGLMGFLVLWALKLGRLNKIANSLVLTAAILLLINPLLLRDDVGFQLSFLAVAGLVYVYPIMKNAWQKLNWPAAGGASEILLMTLAAQIFTWPILADNFGRISLIAPLANLAVLWILPPLTILILAALPLSWFWPAGGFLFFLPAYLLTKYIFIVVKFLAAAPLASVETGYLSRVWLAFYYLTVVVVLELARRRKLLREEFNGKM